ncbi:hypothetical protein AB0K40_08305 [Nonomuraea bangladeshensis]|uniref:Uncharacterized protein n=1 Tax=Nonomuraea bangladeshensis TaxID=404385 RepID=A0ABV3GYY3_9ACTN
MGTSGAYGGSGANSWDTVHDSYADAANTGDAGPSPAQIENFVNDFMAALAKSPGQVRGPTSFSLPALRLTRRRGDGLGSSSSTGSTGGGRRDLGRQAARGAAAVAGAHALRTGNAAILTELGLDVDHIRSLPPGREQCTYIVNALLGAPSHPDEVALAAAALRTMVEVQKAKQEMSPEQTMETFLQNLAYEQVLVELTSQRRTNTVTPQRAKQIEEKAKKYLRASVTALRLRDKAKISAQGFVDYATGLAGKIFQVFRMRGAE